MSGRSSAAVESMTRGSSTFSIGGIAGSEPVASMRVLELHGFLAAGGQLHREVVRVDDFGPALDVLHLAMLDQLAGSARQPLDDVVLEVAQLVEVDLRLAELDAPRLGVARFVDQLGDMEQRLGRNAAAIDAHAAGVHFGIDERDAEPEIGGEKRGRVPAGPPPTTTSCTDVISHGTAGPRRHQDSKSTQRRSDRLVPLCLRGHGGS